LIGSDGKLIQIFPNLDQGTFSSIRHLIRGSLVLDVVLSWNTTVYGSVNPFRATKAMIAAAENQTEFYAGMWRADRLRLYHQYLADANCTDSGCQRVALDRSVSDATGSAYCGINNGASAWFWFVFMTTVGT
jgi:hypothetical protein